MMRSERRLSRAIVGGGAAVALALFAVLLFGRGAEEGAAPVSPPAPTAPPPPQASAIPSPPAAPPASIDGLLLHGIAGAGAIIGTGDGNQRLIAVSREVRPGLTLVGVGVDHALLQAGATTYRLGFDGVAAAGPPLPGRAPVGTAALREEALPYRLAFAPVTEGGRVIGHAVRDGASVPALEDAGIRPGDVIRRVNGAEFDAERREELAWTLANTDRTTFEIVRNDQPLSLSAEHR